ncbi:MAG: hypothetical protein B7C24_04260 [Bacteroidetes bacterium 4572_77]|nr:MAG: hypothetical protein B7C24_04260 [Bacteroidetes bacterium 4572_77]
MNRISILWVFLCAPIFLMAQENGELQITTTTSQAGGSYAPKNILAVWVENPQGEFVKTLMAYANSRITFLNMWQASTAEAGSEFNTVDAITGPTKNNHSSRYCTWNGTNYNGEAVDNGSYYLWMELTDKHATGNYVSFEFVKEAEAYTLTPDDVPSFSDITLEWLPGALVVEETLKQANISVSPNPSQGLFEVQCENLEYLELKTISGQCLQRTTNTQLDIRNQKDGLYLLIIKTNQTQYIRKIILN